ncbi:hypothetical protein [Chryseobacterium carnipullorum]|uniref:hypothetical protein n=1 Tax=Chryseobacterium carnipullorum TaxID=1124835 RepID=UPI000E9BA937|nr:hypothetical protein [Chryseobacterium carnipullorum]HBV15516.1 hypothetical protein [Chryseobacterium carnipullorum]
MSTVKALGLKKTKALGLPQNNNDNEGQVEEVYKIKMTTPLDSGSANEKDMSKTQKGMIHERTYTFIVEDYIGKKPKSTNDINWELSYYDSDENAWLDLPISGKGERIDLVMQNIDTCGRYIKIRAYIHDKKNNAVLKIWKHNRFRWFNGSKLYGEVLDRIVKPYEINQDDTNTCGPSAIMYVFAKRFKREYTNFIINLHRKGYVEFNKYKIDISRNSDLRKISETNPLTAKYFPKNMAYSDWIPNTCITDQENGVFDFVGDNKEDFSAITLPSRLAKLAKDLLGFTDVQNNTNLVFNKTVGATVNDINELIDTKNQGYEVFMLVSMNILHNKVTTDLTATAEHWIVLEDVKLSSDPDFVELKLYTFGEAPTKVYKLSYDVFRTNYYGYVKAR